MWEDDESIGLVEVDVCKSVTADDFGASPNIWDHSFMRRKFVF